MSKAGSLPSRHIGASQVKQLEAQSSSKGNRLQPSGTNASAGTGKVQNRRDGQPNNVSTTGMNGRNSRRGGPRGSIGSRHGHHHNYHHGSSHKEHSSGVRADSRIGKVLTEFSGKDDWVSITILKQQMAMYIQANVRGWLVRKRWQVDPKQVADDLHAKMQHEVAEKERRSKLRRQLEQRALTSRQKKVANQVVNRLFGSKALLPVGSTVGDAAGGGGGGGGLSAASSVAARLGGVGSGVRSKWTKLQRNADIAVKEMTDQRDALDTDRDPTALAIDSDDDSDFSDLEMEDIAAVKLRAKTPPWQKQEHSQWLGQFNKLQRAGGYASLELKWDMNTVLDKLTAVRSRRLGNAQAGSCEVSGGGEGAEGEVDGGDQGCEGDDGVDFVQAPEKEWDPISDPLPPQLITSLLQPKYKERMIRLGLIPPDPPPQEHDAHPFDPSQQQGEEGDNSSVDASAVDSSGMVSRQASRMGKTGSVGGGSVNVVGGANDLRRAPSKSKLKA